MQGTHVWVVKRRVVVVPRQEQWLSLRGWDEANRERKSRQDWMDRSRRNLQWVALREFWKCKTEEDRERVRVLFGEELVIAMQKWCEAKKLRRKLPVDIK